MKFFRARTALYAGLHLSVDGLCAVAVFSRLYAVTDSGIPLFVFIAYNAVAFVLQPLFGRIVDRTGHDRFWLRVSLLVVAASAAIALPVPLAAVSLGLGNGLFHVAGGKYVLARSKGRSAPAGVFVASGATGLAVGTFFPTTTVALGFLLVMGLCLLASELLPRDEAPAPAAPLPRIGARETVWIVLLLATAFLRALLGKAAPTDWADGPAVLVAIAVSASLGKAAGGFVADRIGIRPTALVSVGLAVLLYGFFPGWTATFIAATFAFNMTMPLTLALVNRRYPGREAFGFGLVAATLFPGYVLGLLVLEGNAPFSATLLLCAVPAAVVLACDPRRKEALTHAGA
ncbi:MAG: hypothetical protein WC509_04250 [Candidatus Izemoplasmatales bacterium]